MLSESYCYDTFVKKVDDLYQLVYQIRDSANMILIQGKSGTGKEAICHLLNQSESYKDKPVVVINCAAIPESLMEAELFGFEKGSFTGAELEQVGKFEAAGDGTLILD